MCNFILKMSLGYNILQINITLDSNEDRWLSISLPKT